jgi:uncharacterized membrane protein YphA (DoxX/SURF4 family)
MTPMQWLADRKGEPVMRTASVIARYLAGVIFVVMGLNGFLNFIPFPPPGGIAAQFMGVLYLSHYLWVIFAFQLIAGVLLLANRYVPLAVAVLAPTLIHLTKKRRNGTGGERATTVIARYRLLAIRPA